MTWHLRRRAVHRAQLMGAMLAKLGLDPEQAAREARGAPLATAARRCLFCDEAVACGRWIEEADEGEAPPFCPNADFLERAKALHL